MNPYFSPDLFRFLSELEANNNREWFQDNKTRYEQSVRAPFLALLEDLAAPFQAVSANHRVDVRPIGGSMFRINRDTRFSRDKSPYKTHVAAYFAHVGASKNISAPGFYLHLGPDDSFQGGGIWHPDTATLRRIRQAIVDQPERWQEIQRAGVAGLGCSMMVGDPLKRVPAGFPADHPCAEDLKRKNFGLTLELSDEDVLGKKLLGILTEHFTGVSPMVRFLCDALALPF